MNYRKGYEDLNECDVEGRKPIQQKPKFLRSTIARNIIIGVTSLGVLAGITTWAGNKGPHNHRISGIVADEKEVYGNVVTGYATDRGGVKGFLEKKIHGALRPGPPMHLYHLVPTRVEYDTTEWFTKKHHVEELAPETEIRELIGSKYHELGILAAGIPVQTEGKMADIGDLFTGDRGEFGRLSNIFLLRGVRYTFKTEDRKEKVLTLRVVLKEPSFIKFTKPSGEED